MLEMHYQKNGTEQRNASEVDAPLSSHFHIAILLVAILTATGLRYRQDLNGIGMNDTASFLGGLCDRYRISCFDAEGS